MTEQTPYDTSKLKRPWKDTPTSDPQKTSAQTVKPKAKNSKGVLAATLTVSLGITALIILIVFRVIGVM